MNSVMTVKVGDTETRHIDLSVVTGVVVTDYRKTHGEYRASFKIGEGAFDIYSPETAETIIGAWTEFRNQKDTKSSPVLTLREDTDGIWLSVNTPRNRAAIKVWDYKFPTKAGAIWYALAEALALQGHKVTRTVNPATDEPEPVAGKPSLRGFWTCPKCRKAYDNGEPETCALCGRKSGYDVADKPKG